MKIRRLINRVRAHFKKVDTLEIDRLMVEGERQYLAWSNVAKSEARRAELQHWRKAGRAKVEMMRVQARIRLEFPETTPAPPPSNVIPFPSRKIPSDDGIWMKIESERFPHVVRALTSEHLCISNVLSRPNHFVVRDQEAS